METNGLFIFVYVMLDGNRSSVSKTKLCTKDQAKAEIEDALLAVGCSDPVIKDVIGKFDRKNKIDQILITANPGNPDWKRLIHVSPAEASAV